MSGLRAALETGRGGTFRSTGAPERIADIAQRSGWRTARLDTGGLSDKADLMERVATALDLPAWFGRNWDALEDALRDLDHRPGTVLTWAGSSTLAPRLRETLWEILQERAEQTGAPAFVLVRVVQDEGPTRLHRL